MSKKHPSPSLLLRELFQLRPKTVVRHGLDKLSGYIDFEAFRPRLDELCRYSEKGRPHYDVVVMYAAALCLTEKSYFCFQRAGKEFYSMSGHWVSTIFSRVSVA